MKTSLLVAAMTAALTFTISALGAADLKQDTKSAANDVSKTTKKTVRSVKDKTCRLVDGKVNCFAKKLKHKAENATDEIKSN